MGILYPPIVDTYMPTFIVDNNKGECEISFSLSDYCSIQDLQSYAGSDGVRYKYIQLKIVELQTNKNTIIPQKNFIKTDEDKICVGPSGLLTTIFDPKSFKNDKYYFVLDLMQQHDNQPVFNFQPNIFYKIQMRFINSECNDVTFANTVNEKWLQDNSQYLSSWSTITIVRGIKKPKVKLEPFEGLETISSAQESYYVLTNQSLDIVGLIEFESNKVSEYLKNYQIKLIDGKSRQVLSDSGILYPEPTVQNQINYTVRYLLNKKDKAAGDPPYFVDFTYTTNNDYTETIRYVCYCKPIETFAYLNLNESYLDYSEEKDEGCLSVNITLKGFSVGANGKTFTVHIKRADMDSRFTIWEDVHQFKFTTFGNDITYRWKDLTVQSGTLYKYAFQIEKHPDAEGDREFSPVMKREFYWQPYYQNILDSFAVQRKQLNNEEADAIDRKADIELNQIRKKQVALTKKIKEVTKLREEAGKPVMAFFEDLFLVSKYLQLRVAYNPSITNFAKKTSEQVVETLGSRYPFILRNGIMNYKTFQLSGVISAESNDVEIDYNWNPKGLTINAPEEGFFGTEKNYFVSKNDLYNGYNQYYTDFNRENGITRNTDFIYEREFRELVLDFLTDNTVKLFRSTPEGNVLVKLTNISLTPMTQLGRRIYSFAATAYEVDECSIDNYNSYDIQKLQIDLNGANKNYYYFNATKFVDSQDEQYDTIGVAYVPESYGGKTLVQPYGVSYRKIIDENGTEQQKEIQHYSLNLNNLTIVSTK